MLVYLPIYWPYFSFAGFLSNAIFSSGHGNPTIWINGEAKQAAGHDGFAIVGLIVAELILGRLNLLRVLFLGKAPKKPVATQVLTPAQSNTA